MFPQRTKILKRPVGWFEEKSGSFGLKINDVWGYWKPVHNECWGEPLKCGVEKHTGFWYCPKCLKKIDVEIGNKFEV